MKSPFTGGCSCGAVRYECSSAPLAMLNCHCRDCQESSGAPFASGVIVRGDTVAVTGSPGSHAVQASSGAVTTRTFCQACGSPLFTTGEARPEYMSIRFTTLDDSSDFRPALGIWTSSAPPWIGLNDELPHFPQSPPAGSK